MSFGRGHEHSVILLLTFLRLTLGSQPELFPSFLACRHDSNPCTSQMTSNHIPWLPHATSKTNVSTEPLTFPWIWPGPYVCCLHSLVGLPPPGQFLSLTLESTRMVTDKLRAVLSTEVGGGLAEHLHLRAHEYFFIGGKHLICRKLSEWVLFI